MPYALAPLALAVWFGFAATSVAHADDRYSLTYTPTSTESTLGDPDRVDEAEYESERGTVVDPVGMEPVGGAGRSAPNVLPMTDPEPASASRDWRYQLTLRTETTGGLPGEESGMGVLSSRLFEVEGAYHQELGAGFGYGLNLGLGMETRPGWSDLGPESESTAYFTDFSFGPTFASGRFDSQFRVGVRQSLAGEDDALGFGYGTRHRELGRSAGYLSIDSRLRLQNQSELSLSLYYDDYSLNTSSDWMSDRLDFESTRDPSSSVVGVEMGLTF
ncbi:hypothetical protein [Thioalkalivibrio thiocyanoxidans]|uniref:hypothetical protein n=1 Tax=Thioalkalivibrio thiocyanoxidans TaxID=152475 RepID=UPI000370408B|nr:hypothetical protein [Thioalkalivibrio thiocyanoxidans]